MTEPTYTITQAQYAELISRCDSFQGEKLLRSLKPNTQTPISSGEHWICNACAYPQNNETEYCQKCGHDTAIERTLYDHPAPISKEEMVKVSETLRLLKKHFSAKFDTRVYFSLADEAITIMQAWIDRSGK